MQNDSCLTTPASLELITAKQDAAVNNVSALPSSVDPLLPQLAAGLKSSTGLKDNAAEQQLLLGDDEDDAEWEECLDEVRC